MALLCCNFASVKPKNIRIMTIHTTLRRLSLKAIRFLGIYICDSPEDDSDDFGPDCPKGLSGEELERYKRICQKNERV